MTISREIFDQQRLPRFGKANPERMTHAFWEWMIRGDEELRASGVSGLGESGQQLRDAKLKSIYGPHRARDFFNVAPNRHDGPIWTFDRMGQTKTRLPDGRLICIGASTKIFTILTSSSITTLSFSSRTIRSKSTVIQKRCSHLPISIRLLSCTSRLSSLADWATRTSATPATHLPTHLIHRAIAFHTFQHQAGCRPRRHGGRR